MLKRFSLFCLCSFTIFAALAKDSLLPQFSTPGGWQKEAFDLVLSCESSKASIYYTLDGSAPVLRYDAEQGKTVAVADTFGVTAMLYEGPIHISKTTPVSAVCVDNKGNTDAMVSQTYLFLEDILRQPAKIDGYPEGWSYSGSGESRTYFTADYAMDPEICFSDEYKDLMDSAFMSIGSMCVVTSPGNIFSHDEDSVTGGIYIHTGKSPGNLGDGWERAVSLEFYDPARDKSFQINCGMLLHGGNSRNPANSPKHSFRVSFRSKYGESKLKYKMFPKTDAVKKFDHLVLRAGYNYTWIVNGSKSQYASKIVQREHAQYVIDKFAKQLQMEMGHPGVHTRFVHLFLNGIYWGLYDVSEKINDDFAQAYLGGKDEDYDVIGDHNEDIDGTRDVYNKMFATARKVTADAKDANYKMLTDSAWLNLDNFIDYMLLNWYIGNEDWDSNNWRCARSRVEPGKGFHYFVWDAETALVWESNSSFGKPNPYTERVSKVSGDPSKIMQTLKKNPEFKILAADHIHKNFFSGGPLSEVAAAALYDSLAEEISMPIIAESARWGDYRKEITKEATDVYTRNDFWYPSWQMLLKDYFPYRTASVMDELVRYELYPKVDAPVFALRSGTYIADTLHITANELDIFGEDTKVKGDVIYYTLNGKDPRVPYTSSVLTAAKKYNSTVGIVVTGKRASAEDTVSVTVKARTLRGSTWSALEECTYRLAPKPTAIDVPVISEPKVWFSAGYLNVAISESLASNNKHAVCELCVYSPDGRELFRTPSMLLTSEAARFDLRTLDAGLYVYRLTAGPTAFSGKFIVPSGK